MSIQQMFLGVGGGDTGLPVEEVFDIKLYLGNNSTNTINNGMNLDVGNGSPGGMVLIKVRDYPYSSNYSVWDTDRGTDYFLILNGDGMETDTSGWVGNNALYQFLTNGFTLGTNNNWENGNGYNHVAWTFMKSPKFFDICTWSGDVNTDQTIDHNLGCEPGMIIAKNRSDNQTGWRVYHNAITDAEYRILEMNSRDGATDPAWASGTSYWSPTSTDFKAKASISLNTNSKDYIAYLFAADEDNIKCGKYTGNGVTTGNSVTVGFEPQFLLIKRSDGSGDWIFLDTTRGIDVNASGIDLMLNLVDANPETSHHSVHGYNFLSVTSDGFNIVDGGDGINYSGDEYLYVAIKKEE